VTKVDWFKINYYQSKFNKSSTSF